MKPRIIALLLFCLAAIPLFAQTYVFENEAQNFELEYPNTWTLSDYIMDDIVFAAYTQNGNKQSDKIVADVKTFRTTTSELLSCTQATVAMLQESHPHFKMEEAIEIEINHKKGYALTYTYTLPPLKKGLFAAKRIMKAKAFVLVKENKEYLMTFTTEIKHFSEYEAVFDKIAKSFRFVLRMNV
jgi:hypothetical protein